LAAFFEPKTVGPMTPYSVEYGVLVPIFSVTHQQKEPPRFEGASII
jgi:hypothetical protein